MLQSTKLQIKQILYSYNIIHMASRDFMIQILKDKTHRVTPKLTRKYNALALKQPDIQPPTMKVSRHIEHTIALINSFELYQTTSSGFIDELLNRIPKSKTSLNTLILNLSNYTNLTYQAKIQKVWIDAINKEQLSYIY